MTSRVALLEPPSFLLQGSGAGRWVSLQQEGACAETGAHPAYRHARCNIHIEYRYAPAGAQAQTLAKELVAMQPDVIFSQLEGLDVSEFNQVFDGDLAERVFLIVSVIFVVLYACGILFMQRTEAKTELQSAVDMKSLPEQQVF